MKIFGHPMSTCTRKVLMTLAETNQPYDFSVVEFATGEHKKPAHLVRQPFGQMPALEDDGFALYESRAMCRYINDKVGGALMPGDVKSRALVEQWISIEVEDFSKPIMKFVAQQFFGVAQPPEVIATATAQLETALGVMDKQLASHPFIAGETFSLADICFMPYLEYGTHTPAKDIIAKFPHVIAWWDKISGRQTWQKIAGRAAA
jgi:glutathione S-transferase